MISNIFLYLSNGYHLNDNNVNLLFILLSQTNKLYFYISSYYILHNVTQQDADTIYGHFIFSFINAKHSFR